MCKRCWSGLRGPWTWTATRKHWQAMLDGRGTPLARRDEPCSNAAAVLVVVTDDRRAA